MYWRDIATLVGVKKTVNENGYKVETEARREVFVNKKSATRSEFYAAKQAGDKIALVLEVRGSDYEGETRIEYGGNPYEVVRTYTRAGEVIELNCKEAPKPAEGDVYKRQAEFRPRGPPPHLDTPGIAIPNRFPPSFRTPRAHT